MRLKSFPVNGDQKNAVARKLIAMALHKKSLQRPACGRTTL